WARENLTGGAEMAVTERAAEEADVTRRALGRVVEVIGPVIDVEFPPDALPEINFALTLERRIGDDVQTITAEVAQHIGHNLVRAICMEPADGVTRGTKVT